MIINNLVEFSEAMKRASDLKEKKYTKTITAEEHEELVSLNCALEIYTEQEFE